MGAELLEATRQSDTELVQSLLSRQASAEARNPQSGSTLLHIAASAGCLALVPVLLRNRASPNRKDDGRRTPLLVAVEHRHGDFAALLAKALKPKEREALGRPLVEASACGQLEEVKILLRCSAPVDSRDREGRSGLHVSAAAGHLPLACLLLDSGADRDCKTKAGCTPLEEAVRACQLRLIAFLVDRGARVRNSEQDALGEYLLSAAEAGSLDIVKTLLNYDAKPDAKRKDGSTAVLLAAERGHAAVGEFLVQATKDKGSGRCRLEEEKLGTMLISACAESDIERAQVLLKCGARINSTNFRNESSLWKAAINGDADVVQFLLKHRPDLEIRSQECGRSPLMIAIDMARDTKPRMPEVVDLLLARRAALPESSKLGCKLCDAAYNGEAERLRLLLHVRADAHAVATDTAILSANHWPSGRSTRWRMGSTIGKSLAQQTDTNTAQTALHRAVSGGRLETARLLLESSADVDAKVGKPGRTALFAAALSGHVELVRLLLDSGANSRGQDKEGFCSAQELLKSV